MTTGAGPTLVGVGVGPGDPDLVTFQAADRLASVDVVFVPVSATEVTGHAERVVLCFTEAWRVEQVVFVNHDDPGCLHESWSAALGQVEAWFVAHPGATAAYATTGDPCIHSTFPRFARDLHTRIPDLRIEMTAGITPMQDLAARSATALVESGESLALFPGTVNGTRLRESLACFDGVVAQRIGPRLPAALATLATAGRLVDAVFGSADGSSASTGHRAGSLPAGATGPYLSTLIVPPSRDRRSRANDPD